MAPTSRITASSLGKMPTTSVRRLISPFKRSIGFIHQLGQLLDPRAQLVGDLSPLAAGGFGIVLGKGSADKDRDDAPALLAGMSQDIAHEVNAAALPSRIQDLSDGGLEPLMRIRDDEL